MRTTSRPTLVHSGTVERGGREYTIQTYYPRGTADRSYWMLYVWERNAVLSGDSRVFADAQAFQHWLAKQPAPTQTMLDF